LWSPAKQQKVARAFIRAACCVFGEGYQLCTILSDARLMANAAAAAVREARGQMAQAGAKTY
jgi:hypothetical protein